MNTTDRESFTDFLQHTPSSSDVSLAILPSEVFLGECAALAEASGFVPCVDAFDMARKMMKPPFRVFLAVPDSLPKPLYDLIVQFPTGMVQLLDSSMRQIVVNPVATEGSAALVLALHTEVFSPRWKGSNLMPSVGMCWQPPMRG